MISVQPPRQAPVQRQLSGLPGLPAEILLSIANHLDDATAICLSAASSRLYEVLCSLTNDRRKRVRSRCAKWFIMAQLEQGLVVDPRGQNAEMKLTCVLCKIKIPTASFERYHPPTTSPSFMEKGLENLHMLSRSSFSRFCEHHAMCTVLGRHRTDPTTDADQIIRWECCLRRMCLHCGAANLDGSTPLCACICPICTKDEQVPTFVRYGTARHGETAADDLCIRLIQFQRGANNDGPLLIVERVSKGDDKDWMETPTTKIPVEFR